jgi:hypothetical protein
MYRHPGAVPRITLAPLRHVARIIDPRLRRPLILLVSSSASGNPNSDNTHPSCASADALLRLGRLDAAEAAYLEALKTEAGARCAVIGLTRLTSVPRKKGTS